MRRMKSKDAISLFLIACFAFILLFPVNIYAGDTVPNGYYPPSSFDYISVKPNVGDENNPVNYRLNFSGKVGSASPYGSHIVVNR